MGAATHRQRAGCLRATAENDEPARHLTSRLVNSTYRHYGPLPRARGLSRSATELRHTTFQQVTDRTRRHSNHSLRLIQYEFPRPPPRRSSRRDFFFGERSRCGGRRGAWVGVRWGYRSALTGAKEVASRPWRGGMAAKSLAGHYGLKSAGGALVSPFWIDKSAQQGDGLHAALDAKVQEYITAMGGNKFIRKVRQSRCTR